MGRLIALLFLCVACTQIPKQDKKDVTSLIWIEGGKISIGNTDQLDAQPVFLAEVTGFWMQKYEVTNTQFSEFVSKTGYVTLAERNGSSYVFNSTLKKDTTALKDAPWWKLEKGANWRHPEGINSTIEGKEWHPVVHIAFEDACKYCEWLEMRLPTEIEREYAAKKDGKVATMNTWQGTFPNKNLVKDGFETTAPVGSYQAGQLGLQDMQGNVWEWCQDPYHQGAYYYGQKWKVESSQSLVPDYFDEHSPEEETRVIRGGSFLCAENYCKGYEADRRMRSSVKMTFSHIGFRCVKSK